MKLLVSVSFLMLLAQSLAQYEGDSCRLAHNGETGVCKNVNNCPRIVQLYNQIYRFQYTTCSYLSGIHIICCPIEATTPSPYRPPQTTRQQVRPTPVTQWNQNGAASSKRLSARKCDEYKARVTRKTAVADLSLRPSVNVISEFTCVLSTPLIVGGTEAIKGEFPHMAAIGYRNFVTGKTEFFCGGSLISELFILTAAHCRSHVNENPFVRLGDLNVNVNQFGVDYNIKEFIRHERYAKRSKQNDIMLLKLAQSVTFTNLIRPACLHQLESIDATKAAATGWGLTEVADVNTKSEKLLKVGLDVLDLDRCKNAFSEDEDIIINNNQVCSGILSGGFDTCQGDSGGPLQIISSDNKCVYEILGITSFGSACGISGAPSVYTRVAAYLDWIENKVWPSSS